MIVPRILRIMVLMALACDSSQGIGTGVCGALTSARGHGLAWRLPEALACNLAWYATPQPGPLGSLLWGVAVTALSNIFRPSVVSWTLTVTGLGSFRFPGMIQALCESTTVLVWQESLTQT